jgi:tetratricopeptide (TPR) repeat protein
MDQDIDDVQMSEDTGLQEHADLAAMLASEADRLLSRYEESGRAEDLEVAISNTRRAVEMTPPSEHADLASRLCNLGDMLLCRYEESWETSDLESAIGNTQRAINILPPGHADTTIILNSLGNMLSSRYERRGNPKDLDDAIETIQRAKSLTSPDHPDMAGILNNLGNKYLSQYKRTGKMEFLDEAIETMQSALDGTSQGPYLDIISTNLTSMFLNRYKRTGNTQDLEKAKSYIENAIQRTPQKDPKLAARLSHLGNILFSRHKQTGNVADLDKAIDTLQRAADLMTAGHPNLTAISSSLGTALSSRYEQTGNMKDLDEAIQAAQQAVDTTPETHPNIPGMLNNLSNKLSEKYQRTGKIENLDNAIDDVRKAVKMTTHGHPALAPRLCSLGNKLIRRYERTGVVIDIEEAIRSMHKSIELTPHDHPDLFIRYNSFGNMLLRRYQRTGDIRDLHESVKSLRLTLDLVPKDHSDLATLLSNLASGLSAYYGRTKRTEYLTESIDIAKRAVDITPQKHTKLANRLLNLSEILFRRFEQAGHIEDLKEAIRNAQAAVDVTPLEHSDLAARLNNQGAMQFAQHKQTGKTEDLEAAISTAQRAVNMTSQDHMSMSSRLNTLGQMLSWRHETTRLSKTDVDDAIKLYEMSFHSIGGAPLERIAAARHGIQLLMAQGNEKRASMIADEAVKLLPQVCSRYLSYEDQQHAILQVAGLAADACSLCLRCEKNPNRALEILEYGRGLIIGYLIDGHGDISEFTKSYPEKAEEFNSLRHKAFMSVDDDEPQEIRLQVVQEREEATKKLESCIQDIRQLPGQDRFLLPPSLEVLKSSASEGPIVLVNLTNISSDAIIVLESDIKAITLPKIQGSDTNQYHPWNLTRGSRDGKLLGVLTEDDKFVRFLSQLWSECVRLVLDELGFCKPSKQELPRVWWIGTGLASSLPFHAAGLHSTCSVEHASNYVISSYTPTIKALRHARENAGGHAGDHSVLVVTMPNTPGEIDLPGVEEEKNAICHAVQLPHRVRSLDLPRKDAVLRVLRDFSIAHFACHGSSDLTDPSSSFLALQGNSDTIPDKLTVQEVANLNLGRGWLAYLSACSTAENKVSGLYDEVLHLASSFQVAGFGHVIASMWPCKDVICSQVASVFYRCLTQNNDVKWSNKAVAAALHAAVMEIRTENPGQPHLWAQYIHTGA